MVWEKEKLAPKMTEPKNNYQIEQKFLYLQMHTTLQFPVCIPNQLAFPKCQNEKGPNKN